MLDINVNLFTQQLEDINWRLSELYQGANAPVQPPQDLLPVAFKELGIAAEELQVAVEELQIQNQELAATRVEVETQRQRYQELFEFAPDGYLLTSVSGTIREANHAAAELLNLEQRFLVGKPLSIFISEPERQTFYSQLNTLQQAKQVQEWVLRLVPRKREPFDTAVTVAAVCNEEGKVVGLRLCMRDVSVSHQRSEAKRVSPLALRQQQEPRQEINDNNPSQELQRHVYLKGDIIPLQPQSIWQVCQGIVKLSTICENGEEVLVGLAGPDMAFGPDLTSLKTYQAIALSQVEVVCFSLEDIAASPSLAQTVLSQINRRLRQTEALLAISGQRRVQDRFHQLLQLLKKEIGQPVAQGTRLGVRLKHQDLADACSTTRVTITRLLGKLQEQGMITIDSKSHIIVRD